MNKLPTLDELRELERRATPGPWHGARYDNDECAACYGIGNHIGALVGQTDSRDGEWSDADEALVIAARNALPHLIAIAEAAASFTNADGNDDKSLCETVDAARAAGLFGEV